MSDSHSRDQPQKAGPPYPGPVPVGEGDVLDDRYRVEHFIGRGASAAVFRATDQLLARPVAVKVFHAHLDDAITAARQRSEMKLLASLSHPNLVTIYDARLASRFDAPVSGGEHTYLVMELVEGQTLGAVLAIGTPLRPAEAARVGTALADALVVVHSGGLVHRDIKPANILICRSGTIKLSDFGIARILESERVTQTQNVVGTPAYFSPEQALGEQVGPPTDIYALGLVLLESLTGTRLFPGTPLESAVARLNKDPHVPSNLPDGWSALLRRMTDRDPRNRPTAQKVADQLRALETPSTTATAVLPVSEAATIALPRGAGTTAWSTPPSMAATRTSPTTRAWWRRAPVVLGLLVALMAAAAVAVTTVMFAGGSEAPASPSQSYTSQPQSPSGAPTTQVVPTTAPSPPAPTVSSLPPGPATTSVAPPAESTAPSSPGKKSKAKGKGKDKPVGD